MLQSTFFVKHIAVRQKNNTYIMLSLYRLFFSLQYLNYPTQVIFKSFKLIPVLIGGIVIQKESKSALDFVADAVMCIGLAVVVLADSQVMRMTIINNLKLMYKQSQFL